MKTLLLLIGINLIRGTSIKPYCKYDAYEALESVIEESELVMIGDV